MKRFLAFFCFFVYCTTSYAANTMEDKALYAQSAVLMDAESGRILYEKNGYDQLAMASTTKIMTCIIALENGVMDTVVTASEEAEKQPKVHLGMKEGEQFYLKDLLYSLMLESHNDSAVAIAEAVAGSVHIFCNMMNKKAEEIGCENTYFVTPNGLDETNEGKEHSTTAADLAMIMRYCILESPKSEAFLEITGTENYSFSELKMKRTFQCYNRNSLLYMMDGAFSGKTGYTNKAGYCYVGALERDGKTFIVSLLACGWPNNKNYKWIDAKKLLEYAVENYEYKNVHEEIELPNIIVHDGVSDKGKLYEDGTVSLRIENDVEDIEVLLSKADEIEIKREYQSEIQAPVKKGTVVGSVRYTLNGEKIAEFNIVTEKTVEKRTIAWYFKQIFKMYAAL